MDDDGGEWDGLPSHGICIECLDYFFPKEGPRSFDEFLDLLAIPVIVIDGNFRVVATNEATFRLLANRVQKVVTEPPGVALECPYARLPEGCGQTVHCRSCAVRLTVLDTFATGQSHYDVPAYRDNSFGEHSITIHYRISTEKLGKFVLLRIHEAEAMEETSPAGGREEGCKVP